MIKVVNNLDRPVVLYFGVLMHVEEGTVTNPLHLIVNPAHPSPLSVSRILGFQAFLRPIHS